MCDSKELLVGYLYDDIGDADRRAFEAHLASCGECRDELVALRATRLQLAAWNPGEPDLGFRIVKGTSTPPRPRAWLRPAWGLAAAALLVLAAGAAIANLDVQYEQGVLTVRTGWAPRQAAPSQQPSTGVESAVSGTIAELERRLQAVEKTAPATAPAVPVQNVAATAPRGADDDFRREVRQLLADSESRQQRDLALRVGQVSRDFERQRRIDLATIQQGLQAATGEDAVVHRQMMDYVLYRVGQQIK